MMLNIFLSLLTVASATSYCPSRPANNTEQISIFHQFVQKFYLDKNIKAAFDDHFSPQWIEHSPDAPPGTLDQTISALTSLAAISNFTIIHAGFYNNTGYVHLRQDTNGTAPVAIADIFGFNGSCVVEHWDITQARPANPVNPNAMW
jgi:predicted SnoaL-like aldol condensation-catalyzing enzyme